MSTRDSFRYPQFIPAASPIRSLAEAVGCCPRFPPDPIAADPRQRQVSRCLRFVRRRCRWPCGSSLERVHSNLSSISEASSRNTVTGNGEKTGNTLHRPDNLLVTQKRARRVPRPNSSSAAALAYSPEASSWRGRSTARVRALCCACSCMPQSIARGRICVPVVYQRRCATA